MKIKFKYKFIIVFFLLTQGLFAQQNKLNDNKFEIELLKASNFISLENYKAGYHHLERSLLSNPENINTKLYIAIFLSGIKRYLNSLAIIFKTPELKKRQIAQFYIFYNYHFLQKDLEKTGIKQFNESKEFLLKNNDELSEDKLLFLSVATFINKDYESSLFFFKKSIEKNPNILSLNYQVNFGKDITYNIFKNLSPPYDNFYYNSLGKIQIRFKDYKKAILTLQKAFLTDKKNHVSKKLLAQAYIKLEKYDLALKYLREIKDFFFDNEEVFISLKTIYSVKKDNKKLLKICKEGLKNIPYSKDLRYCVAEGLYKNGKLLDSLFNLEYLLHQYPESVEVNFLTGEVLEEYVKKISLETNRYSNGNPKASILKNFNEPIEYYIRAFQLNPIEPKITKKMFGNIVYKLFTLPDTKELPDSKLDEIRTKANNSFLEYYEPFALKENVEIANIEFHKKFTKYITDKSPKLLKEMGYLSVGKTILLYIDFLNSNNNNNKKFNKFMSIYSKKYFEIFNKKYHFNQFLYYFNLENNRKSIEQLKVFDFIIPSYFD